MKLTEPLYLGGVPPLASPPPELWSLSGQGSGSGSGRGGLVGCVRDLVINGLSVQLGELAKYEDKKKCTFMCKTSCVSRNQDPGSVRPGCQRQGDQCTMGSQGGPCHNGGQCTSGWNRFICDCTQTNFTGPSCARGGYLSDKVTPVQSFYRKKELKLIKVTNTDLFVSLFPHVLVLLQLFSFH